MPVQGNYGTESSPWSNLTSEQIVLTPRTSDPSSPTEGDWWLRTDLDSGDKIATVRFQHGSGTWDIPVFATGTSETGVEEVLRIQTPNGEGFIPTVQDGGVRKELAIQHGGNRHGWHTSTAPIPDSVVLQYFATEWSQGDGTWPDDTATADMSINGDPQDGTLSDGNESADFDGTDDHGTVTLPSSLEGSDLNAFAVEFAIEYTTASADSLFGVQNDDNTPLIWPRVNQDEEFNSDEGNVLWTMRDADDNRLTVAPSSNPGLNDGNRHNISFVANDTSTADVEIIIDGTSVSLSTSSTNNDNLTNWGTFDYDCAFAARNASGSIVEHLDCEIGAIRWHDSAISEQTIDDYP